MDNPKTYNDRKNSLCLAQIQDSAGLWYIVVPITIIMTVNVIFYVMTAVTIFKVNKRVSIASSQNNQKQRRK
jgi:hypothetical protein